jgi:spore coat polysaccharide biosynthesis protein SpsF
MGSTRLPGKVALQLGDRRVLDHVVEHALGAETVDQVVVATTYKQRDNIVETVAERPGVAVARGSEDDVLARVCDAVAPQNPTTVVRLTADNPLVTPGLIDAVVVGYTDTQCVYASNTVDRVLPLGLKAEAVDFETLQSLERTTTDPRHREHVTTGSVDRPERYPIADVSVAGLVGDRAADHTAVRLTVDEPADYRRVGRLVRAIERPITIPAMLDHLDTTMPGRQSADEQ